MRNRPAFNWNAALTDLRAARANAEPAPAPTAEQIAARRQANRDARVNAAFRAPSFRRNHV